ncbi:peptidase M4 [Vreelandella rituensis]|uniref:Peptidase M4 n=1 Tax=Vreelandella rituensis TaxID=2282306 RepID=A0A368TQ01_9GAMM|nr:peptidase M4 [Halomonas rituensis]
MNKSQSPYAGVHSAPVQRNSGASRRERSYTLGEGVLRLVPAPYERQQGDPLYRRLHIYTADPSTPQLEGAVALVEVPYEPLERGPAGRFCRVDDYDETRGVRYRPADLDENNVLIRCGYEPSQSDPRFHQQMVYVVCSSVCATFRVALGRQVTWRPGVERLVLRPHARVMENAYYDDLAGAIDFGYYPARASTRGMLPGGFVFTCLSHDIVTHEVTHALLDGLRAEFSQPCGLDVVAFHEAFADLVAILQRFRYRDVVLNAIRRTQGDITGAGYLTELARQFGNTTGRRGALRDAISIDSETDQPMQYSDTLEPHALGAILVAAIFEAFSRVYRRKTQRYVRLATGGTGILPPGEIMPDLQTVLADEAAKLAGHFLSVCIRAIDYCPPVGVTFGDYLRALITADADLVPDDRWDYRGTLIEAFRRRNIYPRHVTSLTQDALLWRGTRTALPPIEGLSFAYLKFRGDPACVADADELRRQAEVLGEFVTRPEHLHEFGLVAADDPRLEGDSVSPPRIESIRSARRIGPDGQVVFDLIAEVIQARTVRADVEDASFIYHGGATVILGPAGNVRYVILKSLLGAERRERRRAFFLGPAGSRYWELQDGSCQRRERLFALLHESPMAE